MVDGVSDAQIREIFRKVAAGEVMKEALSDVFVWLSKNEGEDVQKAVTALGLKTVSEGELRRLIDAVVEKNKKLVQERGEGSFGVLMGIIMKDLRGKVEAAQVGKFLGEKLKETAK